ncbi:decaprenyl-phosphate phosphoribosyltransferase [Tessaracoccus antarcticus]|uniref:Decaprenyl-phosphate phosphoribosyltransferase n=1 Tax=Tessaracoccus antarcticus TaxID=2479848 RepID=A0A3M0GLD0_9ACTN|nr:decaprenyl-phosphate phosphoribosyltransferase [Tessaracoccus antarcticus]RMB61959.1 decaprenyl-phosphate phosphoribosyltransferase [Tessaracoccus antarcticus]
MSTVTLTPGSRAVIPTGAPPMRWAAALLRTARPRQWIKNVLVVAAPAAAGILISPSVVVPVMTAMVAFVLASASTYFVNDARDVDADRANPAKALRPVAAGEISPLMAYVVGALLAVFALAVAVPQGWPLVAVLGTYLVTTTAYSRWLKHQPIVDILVVAAGFVLRAVAGAVATGTVLSSWFLLVALFGSLFIVTAKRSAEHERFLSTGVARSTVQGYPTAWLQQVLTLALAGTVLSYATWALQYIGSDVSMPLLAVSVVPFLAVMLRYSLLVSLGAGEAPENLLGDRFLLVAGVLWAAAVGSAIYLA